jgi:hypothetical protein
MDPNLVENTMNQLNAKNQALNLYSSKYGALASQIVSIQKKPKIRASKNKKQANFKIKSDSIDLVAVKPNLK